MNLHNIMPLSRYDNDTQPCQLLTWNGSKSWVISAVKACIKISYPYLLISIFVDNLLLILSALVILVFRAGKWCQLGICFGCCQVYTSCRPCVERLKIQEREEKKKNPDVIESVCKLLELRSIERLLNTLKLHPWRIYSGSLGL